MKWKGYVDCPPRRIINYRQVTSASSQPPSGSRQSTDVHKTDDPASQKDERLQPSRPLVRTNSQDHPSSSKKSRLSANSSSSESSDSSNNEVTAMETELEATEDTIVDDQLDEEL